MSIILWIALRREKRYTGSPRRQAFGAPDTRQMWSELDGGSGRGRSAAFETGAVMAASETPSLSAARPLARAPRSGSPYGTRGGCARAWWRCTCSAYVCAVKVGC